MVLFCFSGAVLGVVLFWKDMNRTLTKLSEIPVGIVSYKHNSAQRRFEDRLIWSQLQQTSPIYNGDIIRTSDLSDAAITFTNQDAIVLAENCLIQVFFSEKGARIELSGGTVNVNAKEDGLVLVSGENTVTLSAGSVISAGGDNQGFNVQVVEGNATISTRTGIQEASAGSALSVGTDGITQNPQVAVLSPLPNQQFLNASTSATPVSFSWKAINFSQDDYVRLEIAADRRFTRIIHTLDAHDTTAATVELAPGTFWWRAYATTPQEAASQQNASGSAATGRLTVLNADPPALVSPAPGAAYSYRVNPSTIRFQWSAPTGTDQEAASEYLLEAADNPEMRNPQIRTTVQGSSFVYPGLEKGNWYWRVTPLYDGSVGTPVASPQASFVIEQNTASQSAPELLVPATGSAVNISAGGRGVSFSWKDEPDADSYTIEITEDQNGQNPVLTQVVRDNFYTNRSGSLGPGQYFWRVYYTDSEGNRSPVSASRSFLALQGDMIHETLFPPDDYTVADEVLPGLRFTWTTNLPFTSRFQLSPAPDFSLLLMDTAITGTTRERGYQGVALADGTYYWRISTTTALGTGETVLQSSPKRLVVVDPLPMPELESPLGRIIPRPGEDLVFQWSLVPGADSYEVSLYEGSAEQGGSGSSGFGARGTRLVYENPGIKVNSLVVPMNSLKEGAYFWTVRALVQESPRTSRRNGPAETGQFLLRIPRPVHLEYPPLGHTVTGLDAQRRPGMVWWSAEEALGTSRFILSRNPNPLEGEPVVEVRDPSTSITLPKLSPGTYYWTIQAETVDGFAISAETPGSFQVLPVVVPPVSLDFPQTGYSFTGLNALRYPGSIRWNSTETVGSSRFILSQNPDPLQGEAVLDLRDPGRSITLPPLSPGTYYWTILAETSDGLDISAARPASFRVLPLSVSPVSLDSPVSGYRFTGLDALRQPGTVRWSSTETVGSSRFILSRNANPLQGEAVLEVRDPGRFILLPKLTEGTYYWTIQAETPDGLDISAAQPASFQVLPARATPVSLESPAARFTGLELVRRTATLRWSSTETLGKARFILSQNANPLQGEAIMDVLDPGRSVLLPKLAPGTYYWTIQAETPDGLDISAAQPGSFQVLPVETSPVSLDFPEAGHPFTGLGMVRRTATLRWSSIETVGKSRLIIAQNADPLQGEAALDMTNPSTTITLPPLAPGTYYWTIQAETPDGLDISAAQPGSFRVLPLEVPAVSLDFPASGYRFPGLEALRRPGTVRWNSTERVGTSRFILSRNPDPMQGTPVLELRDPGRSITLPQLAEGTYYWTIQAETPDGLDISAAQASSFQVLPVSVPPVRLDSPSAGYAFTGLDALRWPGTIRWSSTETVGSSRFILSRNPDPLQGEAILEVANPGKSITLPQLAEGTYYWTIQAETPDGLDISAARPSRFQVLPIPLLPQPQGMRPENGYRIDVAQVQRSRSITFTWDPVSGANAYRLTLIANTPEQRPILRTDPMRTIGYRIADLSILDVGDFIWQVEALSIALDGTVEQRGTIGENRFTIDIPSLSNPKLGVTGSLYGNDN
ncbi:MAG: hypothetical protein LBU17_10085 [Treponema sp.]|jgi:hypothetical protein|nr:hypothetical protein [Treponema sp.]